MFDISYGPWLIFFLVGLIFFKPDDWQELAFQSGRLYRRARVYMFDWQQYIEQPDGHESNRGDMQSPQQPVDQSYSDVQKPLWSPPKICSINISSRCL